MNLNNGFNLLNCWENPSSKASSWGIITRFNWLVVLSHPKHISESTNNSNIYIYIPIVREIYKMFKPTKKPRSDGCDIPPAASRGLLQSCPGKREERLVGTAPSRMRCWAGLGKQPPSFKCVKSPQFILCFWLFVLTSMDLWAIRERILFEKMCRVSLPWEHL